MSVIANVKLDDGQDNTHTGDAGLLYHFAPFCFPFPLFFIGGETGGQSAQPLDPHIDGSADTRRRVTFANWAISQAAPPTDCVSQPDVDVSEQIEWIAARSPSARRAEREAATCSVERAGEDLRSSGDVAKWILSAREDIRTVVSAWNGPLAEYCVDRTKWADVGIVHAIQHGAAAAGKLPRTGIGTPMDHKTPQPLASLKSECRSRNEQTVRSLRDDPHGQEILRQVRCDSEPGVDRMTVPIPLSEIDLDACLLAKGFAIDQGKKSDGSPKLRVVWDETASGTNEHTQPTEKLSCDGVDKLLSATVLFYTLTGARPSFWKADIDSAFRRVPVGEGFEWLMWTCWLTDGKAWASRHRVFPFGCVSAVHAWNRVGAMLRHIAMVLLHIPIFRYVDDFFGIEHDECIEHVLDCFKRIVRAIMGAEAIADPKCDYGSSLVVLGLQFSYKASAVSIWPAEKSVEKWIAGIWAALGRNTLGPGEASKTVGRLSWANAHAFGRLGRAMLWPIRHQQYARSSNSIIGPHLRIALSWWCQLLIRQIGIVWPLQTVARRHMELFCDAEGSPPRLAGILFSERGRTLYAYKHDVSRIVIEAYRERNDAQIMTLEIMAILVALTTFSNVLCGASVRVWTDNVGGECTLRKGTAKQEDHNLLVFAVWLQAARIGCSLWFERVGTKDNIADQPSRGYDEAVTMLGARWVEAVVPGELGRPAEWVNLDTLNNLQTLTRDGACLAVEAL
jgi:hypothetical protein